MAGVGALDVKQMRSFAMMANLFERIIVAIEEAAARTIEAVEAWEAVELAIGSQ